MRRTGAVAAGIVGGMLLLSGCGAVDLPLAGVRIAADGTPYAVFRPCGDDGYRGPHLDGRPRGGGEGPVTTGWDTDREGLRGDADFPLFGPPAGWRARHRGAQRLLPRHHYVLRFGHYTGGDSYNGSVEFTGEQIGRLRPGRVWADGRAMSPRAFERLAADAC
ncbi:MULTISPECIES: hypothetical protein [Streptomyces]|uniref:Lipoprotein n=1 Tax=Streptomyces bangladeshensis TaxID=295352 RepID=A0ABN3BJP7_9ACTN|nr:hypothetical protein [Streptomyces sp. EAS-AB2608]BCM69684.1 hypothetical protein EASAB2608_05018 [Streptomyces sp. EAS-AB2608]CUW31297.1 hypothetical protein TUE45_06035 [Streptomyces reticuli]